MKLSLYLRIGSLVTGGLTAIILAIIVAKAHPVLISALVVEAAIYFVGEYLRKQGK